MTLWPMPSHLLLPRHRPRVVNVVAAQIVANLTWEELVRLYSCADVFVSLADSIQESFGLTVAEAGACELAVVATDWDG